MGNKEECTKMHLGHCCNVLNNTTPMTPAQIIHATQGCALHAYPCQLVTAARSAHMLTSRGKIHGPGFDMVRALAECDAAKAAREDAQWRKANGQMVTRATSLCKGNIDDYDDTNRDAYNCCMGLAILHAKDHGTLPPFKDLSATCQPKDIIDRGVYKMNRWYDSIWS